MHVPAQSPKRQARAGFTLIEVMIVVAIVAILSAVAIPSYQDHVRRGRMTEAFTLLADFRARMEQYYQDNKNYGVNACADDATANNWNGFADGEFFAIDCRLTNAGQGFTLTATGEAGTLTAGYDYTIDNDGNRQTTQFKGAAVAANCWLTKSTSC